MIPFAAAAPATAIAALLAFNRGTDSTPGVAAAVLALVAGVCSFASLRTFVKLGGPD